MWTLVIIAIAASWGGGRGGASTTTTFLDFQDQQKCNAAATALATTSDPTFPGGEHIATATYRIIAKCVAR
jgi:hypothetical protein